MINFADYYLCYAYFNLHCLALNAVFQCFFLAWKQLLKLCFEIRTFCCVFIKQVLLVKKGCGLKLSIFWNKKFCDKPTLLILSKRGVRLKSEWGLKVNIYGTSHLKNIKIMSLKSINFLLLEKVNYWWWNPVLWCKSPRRHYKVQGETVTRYLVEVKKVVFVIKSLRFIYRFL